jgi:hypothetical protein
MFAIIFSLFISGAAHTNAANPLAFRSYTGEECGVSYPSTERLECGVREFNSCPSASCPGSLPAQEFEARTPLPLCRNPRNCSAEYKAKASSACMRSTPFRRPGRLIDWHSEGPDGIVAKCLSSEVIASCPAQACGPKAFNSCPDPARPFNNTCSLLMTRNEVSDYIETARSQIEVNAQLYAVQKAMFLIQAKNKQESACFIQKWDGNPQFKDLVIELKSRFNAAYGEAFNAQSYDCTGEANITEELQYRDLRCAVIGQDEVLARLNDSTLEEASRRFYGACLSQKA